MLFHRVNLRDLRPQPFTFGLSTFYFFSPAIAMWRAIRRSADGSNPCPKELGQGAGPIARNVATRSPPEGGRGDRPKN